MHIRSKHADHINMLEVINRADGRNQSRIQELETELETSRARDHINIIEQARQGQIILELREQVAMLQQNLIFDQADRGLIVNPVIRHIPV